LLLALIATALFTQRFFQLEKVKLSLAQLQDDLHVKLYPESSISPYLLAGLSLDAYIQGAQKDIVLIGINLTSLLGTYRERINSQLANGRSVTVAIIAPTDDNLDAATKRSDIAPSRAEYYRHKIDASTAELRQMAATARKYGHSGNVKLLLLPYVPTFSIRAFDPGLRSARLVIEIYPHKTADSPPVFVLTPANDRYWFDYFQQQMETMLSDGRKYDLFE